MDIRNHNPISSEFLSFFPKFDREGCNGILFDFLNFLPIAYPKVHLYSGLLFFHMNSFQSLLAILVMESLNNLSVILAAFNQCQIIFFCPSFFKFSKPDKYLLH